MHWKIGKTTTTKIECCCCCCFPPFVLAPAFFFLKKEKRDGLNAETRTLFLSFFSLGFWLVSRRKGCETNTSWRRRKTGTARAQHREQQRLVGGTRRPPNDAHKREESTVQPMSRYIGDSFVCFLLFTLLGTDDGRRNVKMVRKIRRRKRKKITHEKWWEKKYLVGNEGNKKDIEFRQKNKQKNKKKTFCFFYFLNKILPTAHTEHHQYNVMQCVHVLYLRLISYGQGVGEFPFSGGSFWLLWMDTCRYMGGVESV